MFTELTGGNGRGVQREWEGNGKGMGGVCTCADFLYLALPELAHLSPLFWSRSPLLKDNFRGKTITLRRRKVQIL